MNSGTALGARAQRLFLALWPDDGVRAQLATRADQWRWPAACACYAPADWHLTLHFIGDVANEKVDAMAAAAAVPFESFDLMLDQPRIWAHGLAVLCASEVPAPLMALHERLAQRLRALDLALDTRHYVPHVTLARHAEAAIAPAAGVPVRWPVSGFSLVASTGLNEPRYRVLHQYR